jgi:ferric-dicitrate binding protein FerR (iron transport regulator)
LIFVAALGYWTLRQPEEKVYFSTAYGETRSIILPDSTLVTLNANSSLSYISEWNEEEKDRAVWMEGEGFFEVSHHEGQKFIVHTSQAAVEVLGTKFNVSERSGSTKVILSSGKVALHLQEKEVLMEPGEQVSYDQNSKQIEKKIVNTELLTSWRNNELNFEATPLSEIAELLEDNYGYKVIFEDNALKELLFSGTIRADRINILLEALSETHQIQITHQDDILIFKK